MSRGSVQRAVAIVDAGAIERNCARLARELRDGAALCAVVKANGYGHGAIECARAAVAGGASWLAVAAAAEAAELRPIFPNLGLLTMGALTAAELDLALEASSDIAVWRPADGTWYVKDQFNVQWGRADTGDIPVPGDYNGDGRTDVAVWRPGDGVWYVKDQFNVEWGRGDQRDIPLERPTWYLYHP